MEKNSSLILIRNKVTLTLIDFYFIYATRPLEADNKIPQQPDSKNLSLLKQLELIQSLEQEDRQMIFKMIDTFISKKRFKDFLEKNMDSL